MAKVGGLRQSLQLLFKTARKTPRRGAAPRVNSMPSPMAMDAAQATRPFWQLGFLAPREAQELIRVFSALGSPCVTSHTDVDAQGQATHTVTYLQYGDRFRQLFPRSRPRPRACAPPESP
jgi:hypothetical protein